MKLSVEQLKTFRRIQRKHNVSAEFLLCNMPAILRFVHYAITPRPTLMQKLVRRKNRIFLRYNHFRKLLFDVSRCKKNRRTKRLRLQWSKRLVMYLKTYKTVEYVEDEVTPETKLHEEDVSKQLKEQLELLKSGKRIVPLLEDAEQKDNSLKILSAPEDGNSKQMDCDVNKVAVDKKLEVSVNENKTSEVTESTSEKGETNGVSTKAKDCQENVLKSANSETSQDVAKALKRPSMGFDRGNGKFLDMLISKVKNTTDDGSDTNLMEPPKKQLRTSSEVHNEERENSNSSSDFCGFDDSERIPGTFPGMLSTPLVRIRDSNAPFESETLNAFLRDNSLESSTTMDLPKPPPEDGLVCGRTVPPKLDMPALPEGLQGLRTVAERRTFLQRTKNVKYCVINNVGTIFRELQKRAKGHRINRNAIEALLNSSTMPLTRASWKAGSWLLTDEGNYYFQTITVDGKDYRLSGSRANNARKFMKPHFNELGKQPSVCTNTCLDRITFRALRPIRTPERRSKLSDASTKVVYKACPLSQKILQHSKDNHLAFDSLEVVRMPQVELEVFPQLQKPLNDIAKRYLQLILPYDGISREWAEFSVSTLLEQEKEDLAAGARKSFTFKIPYVNDRDTVLVRRVFSRSEAVEDQFDKSALSFRKEIDEKKAKGEIVDTLEEECADVLTDMLNSVAISCCENSFIKDDPDNTYQNLNCDEVSVVSEKSAKKSMDLHPQQQQLQVAGSIPNKKQNRLLMELKRLNATIIDAATSKSDEDGLTCEKQSCKLGCVCASLNEGTTVRQHCGKQKCILDCNCKCPGIMRLETDGRTITTEDAFMLRRQATAKLARMEKEFTSTIVLTGSETLLINESQYDKKRRCTKVPKRYGDFVDPDVSDLEDCKPRKKTEDLHSNIPLEPIMVNEKIYQRLRHCTVNIKRCRDIKDLAQWCMVHNVYNCFCRGQATVGNPIVVEKQEDQIGGTTTDETAVAAKSRTLYSFEKEDPETKSKDDTSSNYESESNDSNFSDSLPSDRKNAHVRAPGKRETISRSMDNQIIENYLNANLNHCRRVVPIPTSTYLRRNKKRVAHVQLFIVENENEQTKLSLSEHVLRSVYYHKTFQNSDRGKKSLLVSKKEPSVDDAAGEYEAEKRAKNQQQPGEKRRSVNVSQISDDAPDTKKFRKSIADVETGESLLLVNQCNNKKRPVQKTKSNETLTSSVPSSSQEQITVPRISQIFSLNANASNAIEMGTDSAAAAAADIPKQSTEAAASAGVSSEAFRSVFQVVIRNMNNLVSKKMQDIDMALKRESRSIPVPNDDILCIIRWNNFLTSFLDGFVFLWEVKTAHETFLAATIRNVMPLVVNALSVINICALSKDRLPLLARMLIEQTRNSVADCLAVVMQGQKLYWYVKGFLRPDKDRVCPKPTPETHPLLTKKINVLCRLLINQQINEHKKRQELALKSVPPAMPSPALSSTSSNLSGTPVGKTFQMELPPHLHSANISAKLKILPIQRNISDHAATILEQMVVQAYGVVKNNVLFRKVNRKELFDICPPEKLVLDHHWLVLDISTDFSHIFIPELKDLLTLDRIQKVISYAISKKRIVKMQFGQKALFNAYVTPLSRRKLYFGPFRSFNHTPKLILLQSVDGQMMLREVYEKKHNIAERADKTTGFWLIQKRGKMLIDVTGEMVYAPQMEPQDQIHEILDDDVTYVPNSVDDVSQVGGQQNEASTSQKEEDDDCVIVEDELSVPKERINYTIAYGEENSELVVVPNATPDEDNGVVKGVHNKFTLLESPSGQESGSDAQESNSINPPKISPDQATHLCTEEAKQSAQGSLRKENEIVISSVTCASNSTIVLTNPVSDQVPVTSVGAATPNSLTLLTESSAKDAVDPKDAGKGLVKVPSSTMKLNKSVTIRKIALDPPPISPTGSADQKYSGSTDANSLSSVQVANNNVGREVQKSWSAPSNKKLMPQHVPSKQSPLNQTSKAQGLLRQYPVKKSVVVSKVGTTQLCPQRLQVNGTSSQQQQPTGQRVSAAPQGGLIVRTPTAINTYMKNQMKRNLIRQPATGQSTPFSLLKPISPATRMRIPNVSNASPNLPPTGVQMSQNSPKPLDNETRKVTLKHPLMASKILTAPRKQPYTTPQKVQFIRYMKNQAKFVNKLSEAVGQQQSNEPPQSDPLQITDESSDATAGSLLQPQLPSEVKTIRFSHPTLHEKFDGQSPPPGSPMGGMKRNSMGFLKLASELIGKPNQSSTSAANTPATVVTPLTKEDPTEFKGIPIDLPRMKKFAIISSPNTTVITPPAPKLIEEYFDDTQATKSNTESVEKPLTAASTHKVIPAETVQNQIAQPKGDAFPVINSKGLVKVTIPETAGATNVKTAIVPKSNTQYGYFQANIEGLPKFVVKRINDDFLVKVPNFNGILKLNGLQTVYNYLNQYTAQKCGKTAEEIVNLKWTFKVQDRTRLTGIKPQMQTKALVNNNVPSSSSPARTPNTSMQRDVKVKQIDPSPVVLVDDE